MNTAFVIPKSNKAKNRFANLMNNNDECIIEQRKETKVFLASMSGNYFFWVDIHNDKDWKIEL